MEVNLMKQAKAVRVIIVCCCILFCIAALLIGYILMHPSIHWNTTGVLISQDGKETGSFAVSVSCQLSGRGTAPDSLELTVDTPADFRYSALSDTHCLSRALDSAGTLPYIIGGGYCYDKFSNQPSFFHFALDTEKELLLLVWDDPEAPLLIVSNKNDYTPEQALGHFQSFLKQIGR